MLYENLNIQKEDLPELIQIDFETHPKRYMKMRVFYKIIFFIFLLIPLIILMMAGDRVLIYIGAALWLFFAALALYSEMKSFPKRGYLLRTHDISYRKGWIFTEVISIPYNRIQHSEVSQGPIERYMKLSTLKVFTAGGSGSDLSIHGLEPDQAEKLREWITEKTALHV